MSLWLHNIFEKLGELINRGECELYFNSCNIGRVSRGVASVLAITLGVTAMAQDLRLRTPRRLIERSIEHRSDDMGSLDAGPTGDFNKAQGPGPGPIGPGP